MSDSNTMLLILFAAILIINLNRPAVALTALLCIAIVCLTTLQVLPIWLNAVAAIALIVVNGIGFLRSR